MSPLTKLIFLVFFSILLHKTHVTESTLAEPLDKHKYTVQTSTLPKTDYRTDLSNLHEELKVRMQKAQHLNHSKIEGDVGLDDIFIAVKTTSKNSNTRLSLVLKTWFQLAKEQTWFFTDKNNETLQEHTGGHLVITGCEDTFNRKSLCCKTNVEIEHYLHEEKKWFCLFEDDSYVNVPRLIEVLQAYNHSEDWYLGKNSIQKPVRLTLTKFPGRRKVAVSFWFATGSAGMCISKGLALKLAPKTSKRKFVSQCEKILSPADVTIGFIIEFILKAKLTIVPQFHSHIEQMKLLEMDIMQDQITFSYKRIKYRNETWWNAVEVPVVFNDDPTRFLSLHCFLFPKSDICLHLVSKEVVQK